MSSKTWYRSLAELENSTEFLELMHREFPKAASEFPKGVSRRRWLQLMGASLILGGAAGCRFEQDTLAPAATRPANRIPGKPKFYNTSFEIAGVAQALRATSYDGRPIKLDGNPDYAAVGGASTSYAQGTTLELYDPDRGRTPTQLQDRSAIARTWVDVDTFLAESAKGWSGSQGAELSVLAEPTSSPTIARLRTELQKRFPKATWFEHTAVDQSNSLRGAELAFGEVLRPQFDLSAAKVVVTIDCDLFGNHPDALQLIRQYSAGRAPAEGKMIRLYSVECEFTQAGMMADHRLGLRPSEIAGFLASVEAALSEDSIH